MYRALYRKWRPQRFEDVVGQRGIVTALRNQIATGRVGHAYLFTGVRGTGKTTCAKIFAKAVNCLHPQNGDPCGECEICKGIDNGIKPLSCERLSCECSASLCPFGIQT